MLDFARTSYFRSRELHRAHNELESRVEQHTTELRLANTELESKIHERKRAEESLQELSPRLLQLRDDEQRRIARELHDRTVQLMGAWRSIWKGFNNCFRKETAQTA
jgi:signal transduction histidine kinase